MPHCLILFRRRKKFSREQLGARLLVDGITIGRWERGECTPQKRHKKRLEKVTGLPFGKIVADSLKVFEFRPRARAA